MGRRGMAASMASTSGCPARKPTRPTGSGAVDRRSRSPIAPFSAGEDGVADGCDALRSARQTGPDLRNCIAEFGCAMVALRRADPVHPWRMATFRRADPDLRIPDSIPGFGESNRPWPIPAFRIRESSLRVRKAKRRAEGSAFRVRIAVARFAPAAFRVRTATSRDCAADSRPASIGGQEKSRIAAAPSAFFDDEGSDGQAVLTCIDLGLRAKREPSASHSDSRPWFLPETLSVA